MYGRALIRDGRYTLDVPFPDGEWSVVVESPGQPITHVRPVAVAPDETKRLDIVCTAGGGIAGRVNGVPAEWKGRLWVVAFARNGVRAECCVDGEGRFSLAPLPPGEYGLKAGHDALRDSEVPEPPLPMEVWQRPADPWRQARLVRIDAGQQATGVELEFPVQ